MAATEYRCTVQAKKMLTPTVFELSFAAESSQVPFHFQAGQFISIVIPGAGPKGRDLRRAYSIASYPESKHVELCVKLVEEGPGTNFLNELKVGDQFRGFAPYGDFVYEPKHGRHVCFIATGTGVAPFRSMMMSDHYKAHPAETVLALLGVRTDDELIYESDFKKFKEVKWVTAVTQPSEKYSGFRGRVTDYLRNLPADFPWNDTEFYLCGNGEMIKEVRALLAEKNVATDSVHQEKYY